MEHNDDGLFRRVQADMSLGWPPPGPTPVPFFYRNLLISNVSARFRLNRLQTRCLQLWVRVALPSTTQYWTHPSISVMGQESDPIHFVTESACDLVFRAIESGWQGPPFDPFQLANFAGLKVLPSG